MDLCLLSSYVSFWDCACHHIIIMPICGFEVFMSIFFLNLKWWEPFTFHLISILLPHTLCQLGIFLSDTELSCFWGLSDYPALMFPIPLWSLLLGYYFWCSLALAWKIPWTEEPGRLQSMGLQSRTWLSNFTLDLCDSPPTIPSYLSGWLAL